LTVTRAFKIGLGWSKYAAEENTEDPFAKPPYRTSSETMKPPADAKTQAGLAGSKDAVTDDVGDTFSKAQDQPPASTRTRVSRSAVVDEACKPVGLQPTTKKQQGIRILG
jgi:hypothetical protein